MYKFYAMAQNMGMYQEYLEILWGFAKAFLVGGGICMIAQVVINFTDLTAGKILVLFMLTGVVLQGLGVYQYLVDFAGAGATVPISGFGYLLAKPSHPIPDLFSKK